MTTTDKIAKLRKWTNKTVHGQDKEYQLLLDILADLDRRLP